MEIVIGGDVNREWVREVGGVLGMEGEGGVLGMRG